MMPKYVGLVLLCSGAIGCRQPSKYVGTLSQCSILYDFAKVSVTAFPDSGQIAPDALVLEGTQVTLHGIAERDTLNDCLVETTQQLAFQWSMTYQPVGGLPNDATSDLHSSGTLKPKFFAKRGTYRVRLVTSGSHPDDTQIVIQKIEAVRPDGWVSIGPAGLPPALTAGRVSDLAFDPVTPSTMYAAVSRGGVWGTTNAGEEWWPLSDHKGFPNTLSVGRVAVAPGGRIYAGTGDPDNGEFPFVANGLYVSNDGGVTWEHIDPNPACIPASPPPRGQITRILLHPSAQQTVYVAADDGVFRSTDAGACWQRILAAPADDIALSNSAGKTALYAAPSNGNRAFLSQAILWTDDADAATPAWEVTETRRVEPLRSPVARIALAASQNVVYAMVLENADAADATIGVFRTTVGGAWQARTEPRAVTGGNHCDGQCSYNFALAVNPTSPDDVYVGTVTAFRSTDGGVTWAEFNPNFSILSDQHVFAFNPKDPTRVWAGNDSGVQWISISPVGFWTFQNVGMATGQFYEFAISPSSSQPQRAIGGLQDQSTRMRLIGRVWLPKGSGDGGSVAYDADNPLLAYFVSNNSPITRTLDEKAVGRAEVFTSDPYRAGVLLGRLVEDTRDNRLYYAESVDSTASTKWGCIDPTAGHPFSPTTTLGFAAAGNYYVGTAGGTIYLVQVPPGAALPFPCSPISTVPTKLLWQSPQPPTAAPAAHGQIVGIAADPAKPSEGLYVTLARYDEWRVVHLALDPATGAWTATPIAGKAGQTGAFPPVTSCQLCESPIGRFVAPVAADPDEPGKIYVGTDSGVMVGVADRGGTYSWSVTPDFPEVWVTSVVARQSRFGSRGIVRAATFGRGIFEHVRRQFTVRLPPIEPNVPVWPWNPFDRRVVHVLPVDYTYDGGAGREALLRLTPTRAGRPVPYFLREQRRVQSGTGRELLTLIYADGAAPLGLETDGLTVELVSLDGKVLRSQTQRIALAWRRPDANGMGVRAELDIGNGGRGQPPVRLVAEWNGGYAQGLGTVSFAAPARTNVTFRAVPEIETAQGKARFVAWAEQSGETAKLPVLRRASYDGEVQVARYRLVPAPIRRQRGGSAAEGGSRNPSTGRCCAKLPPPTGSHQ